LIFKHHLLDIVREGRFGFLRPPSFGECRHPLERNRERPLALVPCSIDSLTAIIQRPGKGDPVPLEFELDRLAFPSQHI
jgi:hypothetical protein